MKPNKNDIKLVCLVAVGVMFAGYAMYQLRDLSLVADANRGFT